MSDLQGKLQALYDSSTAEDQAVLRLAAAAVAALDTDNSEDDVQGFADGLHLLAQVSQLKASNANEEALTVPGSQHDLIVRTRIAFGSILPQR